MPSGANHATSVLMNASVSHLTVSGQGAQGLLFIRAHETAVAVHIGVENSGELALDAGRFLGSLLVHVQETLSRVGRGTVLLCLSKFTVAFPRVPLPLAVFSLPPVCVRGTLLGSQRYAGPTSVPAEAALQETRRT